ncbi:MAG: hemerythrin domain-containing protein [Rhodothermales bacterium]
MEKHEAVIAARIEDDHRRLKQSMDAMVAEIAREISPEEYATWKLDILSKLRDFQNQVLKHFDLEEENGFLDDVLRLAPQHRRRVERLEKEHRKINADLNHIVSVVKNVESPTSVKIERVREQLRALIEVFEAHESAEHDLMQSVYYQDYGVGD